MDTLKTFLTLLSCLAGAGCVSQPEPDSSGVPLIECRTDIVVTDTTYADIVPGEFIIPVDGELRICREKR